MQLAFNQLVCRDVKNVDNASSTSALTPDLMAERHSRTYQRLLDLAGFVARLAQDPKRFHAVDERLFKPRFEAERRLQHSFVTVALGNDHLSIDKSDCLLDHNFCCVPTTRKPQNRHDKASLVQDID